MNTLTFWWLVCLTNFAFTMHHTAGVGLLIHIFWHVALLVCVLAGLYVKLKD